MHRIFANGLFSSLDSKYIYEAIDYKDGELYVTCTPCTTALPTIKRFINSPLGGSTSFGVAVGFPVAPRMHCKRENGVDAELYRQGN